MKDPALFRRTAAAAGLVAAAALIVVSVVLSPPFPADPVERLATFDAWTFTLAQLPFIVGVLGIGHLIRGGAPLLSNLGTSLAVLGGFGHAVYGGVSLLTIDMARDVDAREIYAGLLADSESGPLLPFMAVGLLGTVLGLVLLGVGLGRARVAPRWVGPVLVLFVVVEFAGGALSAWAGYAASALYCLAFGALAVTTWRTPRDAWAVAAGAPAAPQRPSLRS